VPESNVSIPHRRAEPLRRALDLGIASVLILLVLPVMVLTVIGSAVALRAWPFFVQERIGQDGRTFRFVKIRTLPTSVPRYLDKRSLAEHHVPSFCRLLRELHLDELPQLFLVLIGRMSMVGPRPEMAVLHDRLDPAFARVRTSVRPGCTGLWQVSEDCALLIGERPEYDAYYVANRSLRLDLWILARTLGKVLGLGLVSLDDVPAWAPRTQAELLDLDELESARQLEPA
jgi:lipopolysaccharide/colanic/teichoic acid biosynthesis glycosyltransferase